MSCSRCGAIAGLVGGGRMRLAALALLANVVASCDGSSASTILTPSPQLSPSEVAKACTMAMSCVSPALSSSGAECVYELERATVYDVSQSLRAFATCTKTTDDCTTALACASLNHGPAYCASHPESSCDGNLAITCFPLTTPEWTVTFPPVDCHALGMMCVNGGCTDGKTCNDDITSECIGNTVRGCDPSTRTEAIIDCGLVYSGGICGNGGGAPRCMPPGGGICADGSGSYACQGSVLLGCANLLDGKVDCATIASRCLNDNLGTVDCVANATACTRTSPDRCNGAALEFCQDGAWQDFDCPTVGLGTCGVTSSGGVACGAGGSGADGGADAIGGG